MDNLTFILSQYVLVIMGCFLCGCGVLFMYYIGLPSLRRLGYQNRLDLMEKQKEYFVVRQEFKRIKKEMKEAENGN